MFFKECRGAKIEVGGLVPLSWDGNLVLGCCLSSSEPVSSPLKSESVSGSVVSSSLQSHRLSPVRLLCPWTYLGKNTRVGTYSLLQGIFLTKDRTRVSRISEGRFFTIWGTRQAPCNSQIGVLWDLFLKLLQNETDFLSSQLACRSHLCLHFFLVLHAG